MKQDASKDKDAFPKDKTSKARKRPIASDRRKVDSLNIISFPKGTDMKEKKYKKA